VVHQNENQREENTNKEIKFLSAEILEDLWYLPYHQFHFYSAEKDYENIKLRKNVFQQKTTLCLDLSRQEY